MHARGKRRAAAGVVAAAVVVAGVVAAVVATSPGSSNHPSGSVGPHLPGRSRAGSPHPGGSPETPASPGTSQLAQRSASTTLTTEPASQLSAADLALLRQIAGRTWGFLSGPDLDPNTHLPRNNVLMAANASPTVATAPPGSRQDFTSPTEIGTWLTALVAARDLGLVQAGEAQSEASALLGELERLQKVDGFFLRWYDTSTGAAIKGPGGGAVANPVLSSVDNGWMAQGLLVASQAFPSLTGFASLLNDMQFQVFYDPAKDALYDSYTVGQGPSQATYNLAYGGPRIVDYLAIGSGKVPGSLWYGLQRTPPPGSAQRQEPQGQDVSYANPQDPAQSFNVFEGSYVYDRIRFVPTFAGSMYQALAPAMVYPEQVWSPNAFGLNDRNTALAQAAFGSDQHLPVWGWAPATTPGNPAGYAQYGAPALATKSGNIPDGAVTAYAAFEALPVVPQVAMANVEALLHSYPAMYTPNGFADSVDPSSGQIAGRYMAVSQATVLMALDNSIDDWKLTSYIEGSPFGTRLEPYLAQENFDIQGLGTSSAASGTNTASPSTTIPRANRRNPACAAQNGSYPSASCPHRRQGARKQ